MEVITSPSWELWESIIKNCEHATFFHTPLWVSILEKTYPRYRNATLGFTFNRKKRAIFPLIAEFAQGIFKKKVRHKSMALGVYGGIIAEQRLAENENKAIYDYLATTGISDLKIVENPLDPLAPPRDFMSKPLFTHVITLDTDFTQVSRGFSRGHKSNIKQAEKKGVTIRKASSLQDYQYYYQIYQETIKRWGNKTSTTYPWQLFLNLFKVQSRDIQLWLAEKDDTIIAGVIALYCNNTILYWHGCSLQEYFDHYPNNLLHTAIIRDGCESGYKVYDLNPSSGHSGVVRFKKSLSAKRVDFKAYHWKQNKFHFWKRAMFQETIDDGNCSYAGEGR